jgi:hypothetical protein
MALPIPNSSSAKNDPQNSSEALPDLSNYQNDLNDSQKSSPKKSRPNSVISEIIVNDGKEYKIDPKTGKKYRVLPKSEFDAEGNPILQIKDFNVDDLNSEADEFLAHLRVTPSKEETRALRTQRAQRLSSQ